MFKWNNKNTETLKILWGSGEYTMSQIADKIGCTLPAIKGKIQRLDLKKNSSEFGTFQLRDLRSDQCRFPSGTKAPYDFCGRLVSGEGKSYCSEHEKVVYKEW